MAVWPMGLAAETVCDRTERIRPYRRRPTAKLTCLVLGNDPQARTCRAEQFTSLRSL